MTTIFACRESVTKAPIIVKYGERGYWPSSEAVYERLTARQGEKVTKSAQLGSMFGWDCPAAQLAKAYHYATTSERGTA